MKSCFIITYLLSLCLFAGSLYSDTNTRDRVHIFDTNDQNQVVNYYRNNCGVVISDKMPIDIAKQINEALNFIASIKGKKSSRMHKKIFNGIVDGNVYCSFIKERAPEIYFDSREGREEIASYGFGILDITPKVRSLNKASIASMLLHEVHHNENMGHVPCPESFGWLAGKPGCDDSVFSSYGVDYIFAQNMKRYCQNCKEEEINNLIDYGNDSLGRIINKKAYKLLVRRN